MENVLKTVDYNIHDFVGVRLVNPSAADENAVAKQLGPMRRNFDGKPDLVVRFVSELPIDDLHLLGLNKVGFNRQNFFVLRSSKRDARVRVAFDEIDGRVEIICQSGLKSVPHLLAIINLMLLRKEVIALHASGFVYNDTGIIVTGWAKGGKTEALLSFARHGAEYVGDEWLYLTADGKRMCGIPENIRLWDWHLDNLPHLKRELKFEKKAMFGAIHALDWFQQTLPGAVGGAFPFKFLREALPALKRQLNVQLAPKTIFRKCSETFAARPDKIFLLMSHESSEYSVTPMATEEIAEKMVFSLQFELMPFMESYYAFRFAFPEKACETVDFAAERQAEILSQAIAGKEAYIVKHPYPLSFERLFEVMRPYCEAQTKKIKANTQNRKVVVTN